MKHSGILLLIVFSLLAGASDIQAQNTIPATGGNATGTGGSVSFTVGQTGFTTNRSQSGSVAQGVQQPFEISVANEINEARDISLVCNAYPNPTSSILILKIENYDNQDLSYQLFDLVGTLLENRKVTDIETTILIGNRVAGIYFLKLTDNKKEIKSFKIIKN